MMSLTYEPAQTRAWSTRQLNAVIGTRVTVRSGVGGKPQSGFVADAGIGRFAQAWIEFEDGGSVMWDRDQDPVTITVED
jgi:hypothetical protein